MYKIIATLVLACSILQIEASADTISLANGDRISGEIQEFNDSSLIVKTTYAATITIERSSISSFSTDLARNWAFGQNSRTAKFTESSTQGQVLVDGEPVAISSLKLSPESAAVEWRKSGNFEAALDVEDKDNHKNKLRLFGELNLESKKWRHRFKAEIKNEQENERKTEDNSEVNYALDYLFNEHWLVRGEASYREDELANKNQYTYTSLGPGYRFWGEGSDKLDVVTAYSHFWLSSKLNHIQFEAWSAALNYKQQWFEGKLEIYSDLQIAYPSVFGVDYIENTTLGLRYLLTKHVYLSLKYDLNETKIITNSIKDSSYTLGAGVNF